MIAHGKIYLRERKELHNEKEQKAIPPEGIRDSFKELGVPKTLVLGLQHMFAMFGATILVPILVMGYFQAACGEPLTRGVTVSTTCSAPVWAP